MKIAPSILSASFDSLGEEIQKVVEAGADFIHLDIMDGVFVPNITFGPPLIKSLPRYEAVGFDAHLMIVRPENHIQAFMELNPDRISVHAESTTHLQRILRQIRDNNIKPAVAINPSTPLSAVEWVLDDVDMVLVMSVNPGFSGQTFIVGMLEKIKRLKEMIAQRNLNVEIQVDGGVNAENAKELKEAGVDIAVAGSAVFGQPDYGKAIKDLKGSSVSGAFSKAYNF